MTNKISKNRRIVGWIVVIIGILYIINSFDHYANQNSDEFFDELIADILIEIGGLDLLFGYNDFFNSIENINLPFFFILNLDYIPLFTIGVALILISRKFIFNIPFRGKK